MFFTYKTKYNVQRNFIYFESLFAISTKYVDSQRDTA